MIKQKAALIDMKLVFILFLWPSLLLSYCSNYQPKSNSISLNENKASNVDPTQVARNSALTNNWAVVVDDGFARIAKVNSRATTPDGYVFADLKLQCGPRSGESKSAISFDYEVFDPEKVTSFDFNYFEGPYAPAMQKQMVLIRTKSLSKTQEWRFSTAGGYGGYAEQRTFFFSPNTFNSPDRTSEFVRTIAEGGVEVTLIAYDHRDGHKTIEATFPPIGVESDVAKLLKGCVR